MKTLAAKHKEPFNLKNKKMDDQVFTLRRKVMDHVYFAKRLLRMHGIDLPRINVRITNDHPDRIIGAAYLNSNCIWITEKPISNSNKLKWIVFHEILHAAYGVQHDGNCDLICPEYKVIPEAKIDRLFVDHVLRVIKNR